MNFFDIFLVPKVKSKKWAGDRAPMAAATAVVSFLLCSRLVPRKPNL